jgi:hypothetical protein
MKHTRPIAVAAAFVLCVFGFTASVNAQARKTQNAITADVQQPLFSEYRGVKLGMTSAEVQAKLGKPQLKDAEQEYYFISDSERVQLAYNAADKVVTLSVDFVGAAGAPDYKTVVGGELEPTANGGLYKIVRYQHSGYWVSYHRTTGAVVVVTITMQKI